MRTIVYLVIAIVGNALGTAIMLETDFGMTAWGSAASNFGNLFSLSIGQSFMILSIFFYVLATIIRKEIILKEALESAVFGFGFWFSSDYFVFLLPKIDHLSYWLLFFINIIGMLILLFAIAVHVRLNRFVHPMDVFLRVIQIKLKSISKGTYLAYFIGFGIAVICALFAGEITDIWIGTGVTLISSGLVMKYYNKWILDKWVF